MKGRLSNHAYSILGVRMAYNANGYNAYREIGVKTASQGKMVVMLYEGAVSHIEKAMELIGDEGKIKADQTNH